MNIDFNLKTFKPAIAGVDYIPVTGKVIEEDDLLLCMESVADGWLTAGRFANEFELEFAKYFGAPKALLVNSGSSANLVAFYALTSPKLGERAIKPGDEVITVAAATPFQSASEFVKVPDGTYNLTATSVNTPTNIVISRADLVVTRGFVYTLAPRGTTVTASTLAIDMTRNR